MLTDDLRDGLRLAADEQPFQPDLSGLPRRVRQLRRRRRVVVLGGAGVGVVVIAAAVTLAVAGPEDFLGPSPASSSKVAALTDELNNWGPTRGSYADDSAFLARVKHEWLHPSNDRYYGDPARGGESVSVNADGSRVVTPADRSRHLTGDIRVLFAGQTTDGPAAVVAQRSSNPDLGIYLGIMLPTSDQDFQLVAAYTPRMYAQAEFGDHGFDTNMISFETDAAGDHAVVLPANPADAVSVSLTHWLDSTGQVQRSWSAVPASDGVATVTANGPTGLWDALVRITHDNEVVDESTVWRVLATSGFSTVNTQPPAPSNAGDWTHFNDGIAGLHSGTGYRSNLYDSWLAKFGAGDEPWSGGWSFSGQLGDGTGIFVQQMWLYGDPAHTVVFQILDKTSDVLSDTVTDPTVRPLVMLKLPKQQGWLVIAGPHATIDGYREPGEQHWTDIDTTTDSTTAGKPDTTRAAAVLPTAADHIDLQLTVDGHKRVVSR